MSLREGILFVPCRMHLSAPSPYNPTFIGVIQENPFLKNSLQTKRSPLTSLPDEKGEEIFEVTESFSIGTNLPG